MFLIYHVVIDDGVAIDNGVANDDGVENNDFTLSLSLSSLPVASLVQSSDPETVAPEKICIKICIFSAIDLFKPHSFTKVYIHVFLTCCRGICFRTNGFDPKVAFHGLPSLVLVVMRVNIHHYERSFVLIHVIVIVAGVAIIMAVLILKTIPPS